MATFQTVTMQHFQKMIDKGFVPVDQPVGEIVLCRRHERDPALVIKVYTSIPRGETECRDAGADAIRVAMVREYPDGTVRGVGKTKRVNRTGPGEGVIERVLQRARDLWKLGNR